MPFNPKKMRIGQLLCVPFNYLRGRMAFKKNPTENVGFRH